MLAAQLAAARDAATYTAAAIAEQDLDDDAVATLQPRAFAGAASDGRALDTLLDQPLLTTLRALGAGADASLARTIGAAALVRIVVTQVADAGRAAESAALVVRPAVQGWVRQLQLPSCSRCVVLAGKYFRWNAGFSRHPLCDCRHVPTTSRLARDLTTDPAAAVRSGRVTGLSAADTHAIVIDGADVARVVNATRGMTTAAVGGRRLKATTELSRRGVVRLRPEEIYRQAGDDRSRAIALLARHGYTA